MATSPARLLVALLAVTSVAVAADFTPPRMVVPNPKKTAAAVSREYPPPRIDPFNLKANPFGDLTVVTVVRLDKPKTPPLLLKGHTKPVTALEWSADGKQLASGGLDGSAFVWDPIKGTQVVKIEHGRAVGAVGFSNDGKTVATAPLVSDPAATANTKAEVDARTPGGTAILWDAATGKEVKKLDAEQGPLTAAVRVPKTDLLATAGANKTLCVWTLGDGKLAHTFKLDAPLIQAAAAPDGKRVFGLVAAARQVLVFDPEAKKELTPLKGAKHDLVVVGVSADGKHLLGLGDLPGDSKTPVTSERVVWGLITAGLSEFAVRAGEELKRPCYIWNVASGKVVANGTWNDVNPAKYGFVQSALLK